MWLNGTYSALADLTTYYVNLTSMGFYDLAGNDLTGDTDKNFTTGDYTAPTIASTIPADDAANINTAAGTYVIEFSEAMDMTNTNVNTDLPGASVSWSDSDTMHIDHNVLDDMTKYYVDLTGQGHRVTTAFLD